MSNVRRVYVEKKTPYAVAAKELKAEIKSYLDMKSLKDVRVLIRYDIENVSEETYKKAFSPLSSFKKCNSFIYFWRRNLCYGADLAHLFFKPRY